ncbi:MAG: hypothetical protein KDB16_09380, partial [Acidimicrobiales bacterium]|nr:hypothetical protein [Acidimicrobiales bacterium]
MKRWAGLAAALVVASALLLTGTAGARQAQAQAAISLDLPRNSPLIAGQLTAVEVSVTSQRAVRGVVSVSTSSFEFGGSTVYQVPVELAAGTPVEFPLAVVAGFGGLELQAELVVGGESVAQAELRRFGDEAPGVLAAVLGVDAPGAVEMRAGTGSATTYQVSSERLETVGLLGTSYLITSPGALRSLTQPALLAVITWTADGGQLLVVGAEGSADDLLPEAWAQGPAGLGEVNYVDDSWAQSGLSLPARTIAGGAGQIDPQMLMGEVPVSSIDDLASDAGFSLPSLRSLLVLLGVYVLAAGPITYLVLKRMGSTHLAWRVLPLLAVVCTGMALVVGAGLRSDRGSSYASVVEVWPTGSKATTTILVSSTRSDIRTVEAPQAWHYTGSGQIVGWGPTSEGAVSVEPGRTGVAVSSNLTAGGAASMQLTGPAPQFDGALTIDQIVLDGATVVARVTNNSGVQLTEVVALLGTEAVEIGELADGESRSFTIEHSARLRQRLDELAAWGVNQFGGRPSRSSPIAAGVWSQWRGIEGLNAFPDGYVGVVGWSRDLEPPTSDIS